MKKSLVLMMAFCVVAAAMPLMAQSLSGNPLQGLEKLKPGKTMRSSSCDPNIESGNGDARPILAGATLTIADLEGPGVITHFWNTIAAQERGYSRLLVLRIYWDGEENPSVECPIGDFFVIGHGMDAPFESMPVSVSSEGRARNCYWPMPFAESAKITVTNQGEKSIQAFYYYVDWQQLETLPEDAAYFHAMYRQEYPTVMGRNYMIADIEGKGHYVGTVMNVYQHTPSWWGEGDDFWYIDGETEPRLRGTGSEDYFCDAWGFRKFDMPFYGVPVMEGYDAWARTSVYRWHITDPVCFEKSLHLEIEHKGVTFNEDGSIKSGFEERSDDFASVAFWYQTEPHKPYAPLPPAYDRLYVDWRGLVEAETFLEKVTTTDENTVTVQEGAWSGGKQLFWLPVTEGQALEIPVEIAEEGDCQLLLLPTFSWDYGIYQVMFDGKPVGKAIDMYTESVTFHEVPVSLGHVTAGTHSLGFVNKGKNSASKGYYFGLDGYLITKK